jgi:Tol biopolymer transport system component
VSVLDDVPSPLKVDTPTAANGVNGRNNLRMVRQTATQMFRLTDAGWSMLPGITLQVSGPTANLPVFSPDSKQIACFYWDEQANPTRGVMILSADGGEPTRRFNIRSVRDGFALRWVSDGRSILFPRNTSNIWAQPLDGGTPVQLTRFQGDQIFNFEYSPDGKWIAAARGRLTDDAVLIRDLN